MDIEKWLSVALVYILCMIPLVKSVKGICREKVLLSQQREFKPVKVIVADIEHHIGSGEGDCDKYYPVVKRVVGGKNERIVPERALRIGCETREEAENNFLGRELTLYSRECEPLKLYFMQDITQSAIRQRTGWWIFLAVISFMGMLGFTLCGLFGKW